MKMLKSHSPIDGATLGEVPIAGDADVEQAVARARAAFATWGAMSHRERQPYLVAWRRELARRQDELTELIHKENGKPRFDARQEVMLSLLLLDYAAARAPRLLKTRRRSPGFLLNYRATVSYQPYGVVGIIGPWNYPSSTPMGSLASALAAGNTCVFKPSELTPLVGKFLADTAAAHLPSPSCVELVTGEGPTGIALTKAEVDKLSFTGSTATGRKVMAAASERLTPVCLELGGKDPMLVTTDADLEQAAAAAVYGSLANAGQTCISIERIYVEAPIYDRFLALVTERVAKLRHGRGTADPQMGPMTRPAQTDEIREQLRDAADKGARILTGGPDAIDGVYVPPTVVADVTDEMLLMRDETFGPVIAILRVESVEEAMRLATRVPYGLGSAVFAGDQSRALADRLKAGMTAINSVLSFAGIASLPFGGVGDSGFGRIHGDEGLREFARPHAIAERRFALPTDSLTFNVPEGAPKQLRQIIRLLFAGGAVDHAREALRRLW